MAGKTLTKAKEKQLEELDDLMVYHYTCIDKINAFKKIVENDMVWQLSSKAGSVLHYAWDDGTKSICGQRLNFAASFLMSGKPYKRCRMCCSHLRDKGVSFE